MYPHTVSRLVGNAPDFDEARYENLNVLTPSSPRRL